MRRRALSTALSLVTALAALSACRIIPETPGEVPSRAVEANRPPPPPEPETIAPSPEPDFDPDTQPGPQPGIQPGSPPSTDFFSPQPPPSAPAAPRPYKGPPLAYTRIGETVYVDGPKVTPLELLEDSRCPQGATCVWAGRLRVKVRIDLGSGPREMDITLGQPVQVADGQLSLLDVLPARTPSSPAAPLAYQFGFRFMGGL